MLTRNRLLATASLVLGAGALLTGCQGHGKFTSEAIEQAELRQAQMKAATEWDMARQQFLAGDLKKARRSIDNSIAYNAEVVKSHVLRARILIETGDLEMALGSIQAAKDVHAELTAGPEEEENPKRKKGLSKREQQEETPDEQLTEAFYYEGIIYERLSEFEEALESFELAMAADETDAQFPMAAAEMMIELDRLDDAKNLLQAKLQRFEHNAGIRQTLGHIAMIQENYPRAVTLFEEACLLGPGDPILREDLVRAQLASGAFTEAESSLAWLLSEPGYDSRDDLQRLHAKLLIKIDRPVEARELIMQLTADKRYASDLELWIDLGNVAAILKDQHRLRSAGQRVVGLAPGRAEGYIFTAMFLRARGDLDRATRVLGDAIERDPTDTRAPILQGLIFAELNRSDDAREAFALAARRDPQNAQARELLAAVSARSGNALAEVDGDE